MGPGSDLHFLGIRDTGQESKRTKDEARLPGKSLHSSRHEMRALMGQAGADMRDAEWEDFRGHDN